MRQFWGIADCGLLIVDFGSSGKGRKLDSGAIQFEGLAGRLRAW